MKITRIYTGEDGQSHFEDLDVPMHERNGPIGRITDPIPAATAFFRETPVDVDADVYDFHCAPRRQFVIHLEGVVEIEVGDGTARQFGPGEILLADDTTGQGHISRGVKTPRSQIFVALAQEADVDQWR